MSRTTDASAPQPSLIVEHRLRLALAALDCLKRLAYLADEPHGIPLFGDLRGFARVVRQFTRAIDIHIRAIEAVLPPHCSSLDAAGTGGSDR